MNIPLRQFDFKTYTWREVEIMPKVTPKKHLRSANLPITEEIELLKLAQGLKRKHLIEKQAIIEPELKIIDETLGLLENKLESQKPNYTAIKKELSVLDKKLQDITKDMSARQAEFNTTSKKVSEIKTKTEKVENPEWDLALIESVQACNAIISSITESIQSYTVRLNALKSTVSLNIKLATVASSLTALTHSLGKIQLELRKDGNSGLQPKAQAYLLQYNPKYIQTGQLWTDIFGNAAQLPETPVTEQGVQVHASQPSSVP